MEAIREHGKEQDLLQQQFRDMKNDVVIFTENQENRKPSTATGGNVSSNAFPQITDRPNRYAAYRKRQGVLDIRTDFKQTTSCYFALNLALNDEVKDFQMTSNNKEDGTFQDIGLRITFSNGKCRRFLFQLIPVHQRKSISLKDLMSEKSTNAFGVKNKIRYSTEMNLDTHTVCILYTSGSTKFPDKIELTEDINIEQCHQMEFEEFLMSTQKGSECAIFEVKSETLKKNFYLVTSQLGTNSAEKQIHGTLNSVLQCDIYAAFTTYMRAWWSGEFVLMKRDVIAKISELAFSPFLKSLTDEKCDQKSESLKRAILRFPLTIVENSGNDIVENMWKIEEEWMDQEFRQTKNKYELKDHQTNTALWHLGKIPLVVKVTRSNERILKNILNIWRRDMADKKIVLVGKISKTDFGQWETFENFDSPYYQCIRGFSFEAILKNLDDEQTKDTISEHVEQEELLEQEFRDTKQEAKNESNPKQSASAGGNVSPYHLYRPTSADRHPRYRKASGVVNNGTKFEQTMCGYYALTLATNDEVVDFAMTSNNSDWGTFDDICFTVRFAVGQSRRFLFQLVYRGNKIITFNALKPQRYGNGAFDIEKYIKDITKLNLDEKTICIIYTNSPTKLQGKIQVTDEIRLEQRDHIEFEELLVNTRRGCDNAIFEVKSENLNNKFYFLTSQLNVKTTENLLNMKLNSLLQCDIYNAFSSYIRDWYAGRYILTKHDVIAKISELAFTPYLKTLSHRRCNEKTESLKQTIMSFPLTIVEKCDEDIVEHIWKTEWSDREFSKAQEKYGLKEQQTARILWYMGKIPLVVKVNRSNKRIVENVMKLLRTHIEDKNIVLIGNVSQIDFGRWKTLNSLWDVVNGEAMPHCSDVLQKFYNSFQGRERITLKNLVRGDEDAAKLVGTRELLEMSQKEYLLVGNQREELSEFHIPRHIFPTFVKTQDVLRTCLVSHDILVIVNYEETFGDQLSNNRFLNTMELSRYLTSSADNERTNLILLSKWNKCTNFQFEYVCQITKRCNVYLLQPLDGDYCILLLKKGVDLKFEIADTTKTIKESEILKHCNDHLHVLCAPPGMGKSRLMQVLYNSCPSDSLAVYVGLINHNSFLATEPDFETTAARFLEIDAEENDLYKQFKKHFWQKRTLYMFLDGLDEINSQYIDSILNFVKRASSQGVNVWLSSRESLRETICQTLNVVPIDIKDLEKEELKQYIYRKLNESYTNEQIEEITEAILRSPNLSNSRNLVGIPFQLHIITEMFLKDTHIYENLDKEDLFILTRIYKVFFEGKIKFASNEPVAMGQQQQLEFIRHVLQAFEILALKACLSSEDYEKLNLSESEDKDFLHQLKTQGDEYGIVEAITGNDEAIFSHQTFAEYFAATWFRKNKDKIVLIQDRIFSSEYKNFRLFFDIMLAENNPLHLAIIYQDINLFENHFADVDCTDDGGRTAFHLAFSYGQTYETLFSITKPAKRETSCYVQIIERLVGRKKRKPSFYKKIVERFFRKGKVLNQKDDLFGFDCVSYALRSKCLYPIEKILEKKLLNFKKIEKQLYRYNNVWDVGRCSAEFGYPNLLSGYIGKNRQNLEALTSVAKSGCVLDDTPTTEGNVKALKILTGNDTYVMSDEACKYERFAEHDRIDGPTILHILVQDCPERYREEIEIVIKKFDLSVKAKDSRGATALHKAAESADPEILEVLIENGAELNAVDYVGRNALHYAASNYRSNAMKFLLDGGLNVNAQDDCGTTPLHLAAARGEAELVKVLLDHDADPNSVNKKGKNAFDYAQLSNRNSKELIELLSASRDVVMKAQDHEALNGTEDHGQSLF